eukprot:Lithocolla_globosa_v1_NODE_5239_length_1277_cov_2.817512.p3 type:complete len:115 gc:universal NODE_5239_length_1277_cov_2.817512:837-1181(+)
MCNLVTSDFPPAPIHDMTRIFCLRQCTSKAALVGTSSMASMTMSHFLIWLLLLLSALSDTGCGCCCRSGCSNRSPFSAVYIRRWLRLVDDWDRDRFVPKNVSYKSLWECQHRPR